jgi:ubiquinone/menaquinone biosynthesis C-methylase UbiE
MPLPGEHINKVVASASFQHFPNQDRSLEEMKRVLKCNGNMIIIEIDPNTERGKRLKIREGPLQLRKKVEDHGLEVLSINSTALGYFFDLNQMSRRISDNFSNSCSSTISSFLLVIVTCNLSMHSSGN